MDLTRAFATDGRYAWQDESTIFTSSGQASAYLPSPSSGYRIKDTTKPVRITLVWTDAPAAENADVALKNDLDLTVRFQGFSGAARTIETTLTLRLAGRGFGLRAVLTTRK